MAAIMIVEQGANARTVGKVNDALRLSMAERERAQHMVQLLGRHNQMILDAASEAMIGLSLQGRVTFANPAAARLLGWSVAELVGKREGDLLRTAGLEAAAVRGAGSPLASAMRSGTIHRADNELISRKDGRRIYVDYTMTPLIVEEELDTVAGGVVILKESLPRVQRSKPAVEASSAAAAANGAEADPRAGQKRILERMGVNV
jgi:PAS domain S-box-containing protein